MFGFCGIGIARVDRKDRIRVDIWTLRRPVVARLMGSLDVEHQPAEHLFARSFPWPYCRERPGGAVPHGAIKSTISRNLGFS